MLLRLKSFYGKKGQGIVEYAILVAFVVAIAAFLIYDTGLKNEVTATFNATASILHQ
jgi:Flp pilus assembly pilin Flp